MRSAEKVKVVEEEGQEEMEERDDQEKEDWKARFTWEDMRD